MIHGAMIYAVGGFSILSAEARRNMLRGGWAPRGSLVVMGRKKILKRIQSLEKLQGDGSQSGVSHYKSMAWAF